MIKIGPAGIPLSCKGRTVKDGIIYTRNLELDTMQVQFVRGIRMTEEEARELGRVAQEALVELHVHAPYYTNLAGDDRNVQMAFDKILAAGTLAEAMGAKTLAVHCGLYHEDGPERTTELVVERLKEIQATFKENGVRVKLALETAGKQALFGTLDEVLDVCRAVPGSVPILDFAHIHARGNGSLLTQEDFEEVFAKCKDLGLGTYLIHFTGILYENGNERHHLPIKKGDLRFEPLVETILDHDYDVTIISHSPILEHDAMYMKIVLDRVKERRELKEARVAAQKAADEEKERQRREREAAEAKKKADEENRKRTEERKRKVAAKKRAKKATPKSAAKSPKKKAAKKKKTAKKAAGASKAKKAASRPTKKKAAKKAAKTKLPAKKKSSGKGNRAGAKKPRTKRR